MFLFPKEFKKKKVEKPANFLFFAQQCNGNS